MSDFAARTGQPEPPQVTLRAEFARGDAVIGSVAPILRHLLANDDNSLFGDDIIARMRGIVSDLVRQLADEVAAARVGDISDEEDDEEPVAADVDALIRDIVDVPGLMNHVHALALEWQLTDRLQGRQAIDPVLTPLLQALIASADAPTAAIAMNLLAAQARFAQSMRRMQLPLCELPGDLLHGALQVMRCHAADAEGAAAETAIRARYDESRSRLGLIARLVTGMGGGAVAALSVGHAGIAIFMTALALASGQVRELAVLSANEGQAVRLALSLKAAGLKSEAAAEQFLAIHPELSPPDGIDRVGPDQAAAILGSGPGYPGA